MNPTPPAPSIRKPLFAAVAVLAVGLAIVAAVNSRPAPAPFPPLPNFAAYEQIADRKAAFIDYLTPIVQYQNAQILDDRAHLERITYALMNGRFVFGSDMEWLKQLAQRYRVAWEDNDLSDVTGKLLRRIDTIPLSLVIVQAAKESSWGRSRFAVEGNSLFGHWCYGEDCGIMPAAREEGTVHQVRKFKSASNAVRSYLHNLNTHDSYAKLRRIRQQLRLNHRPITGMALAEGLLYYSERRENYVKEVKAMIQQYHAFEAARAD